jgi:hypothetical protein
MGLTADKEGCESPRPKAEEVQRAAATWEAKQLAESAARKSREAQDHDAEVQAKASEAGQWRAIVQQMQEAHEGPWGADRLKEADQAASEANQAATTSRDHSFEAQDAALNAKLAADRVSQGSAAEGLQAAEAVKTSEHRAQVEAELVARQVGVVEAALATLRRLHSELEHPPAEATEQPKAHAEEREPGY